VKTPPNTDGCETRVNTITNCTNCGIACDTVQSTGAACSPTQCTYTGCKTGFVDCVKTAPNADGCETPVSATVHATGITGLSYNDCAPQGTCGLQQALEACTAYTGDGSQCVTNFCMTTNYPLVCSSGSTTKNCFCWSYGGANKGYVTGGSTPSACFCPQAGVDPTWN
jgi:hypothetical protein